MEKEFDVSKFPVKLEINVRSYEVDFQNVVNNAVYFNYFELARIDYRKKMGYSLNPNGTFSDGLLFFVAHNECDYFSPAYLDNELIIYTRIDYIKNSSLNFEHLIYNKTTQQFIARGSGIIVNVDPFTMSPVPIPETIIEEIKTFDKEVKILR
ncbi:MAG: acyl-CoA thioesterase [Ignavibacteria bacterium]